MSVLLVLGCAVLGGAGGAAVPALLRRLPQPDPASLHLPEGEEPPPTYAEVAAAPGLARKTPVWPSSSGWQLRLSGACSS